MSFNPPIGLRNRHIQTIFSSVGPRRFSVRRAFDQYRMQEQPLILDCGDNVRLGGIFNQAQSAAAERLAILIHGWEGSADSSYMVSLAAKLLDAGVDVFRLNMRDHGDTHHLNEGLFNSTLIDEVIGGIADLQGRYNYRDHSLIGFSLGGNFALRAAALGSQRGIVLDRVIAFCPVLHARNSNHVLGRKHNFIYDRYFVRKWKKSLKKKDQHFPHYNFSALLPKLKNLDEMNEQLIPVFTEFSNTDDYFDAYAITGDRLKETICPCYLHFAKDDMIIPWQDVEQLPTNPNLKITLTEYGGHCGYLSNWRMESWQDERVLQILSNSEI